MNQKNEKKRSSYQSDLRSEQMASTRARIIEAAAERFAPPWSSEMPFDKVAERARVSERTVYRHFPTQRDLLQAVTAHLIEQSGWDPDIGTDDLGAMTARAFSYFGSLLDSAEYVPEPASPDLQVARGQRLEMIERIVGPYTERMDPDLARGVCAVFAGLIRLDFMRAMYEHWGLTGAEAGRSVEWAINALLTELRRQEKAWNTTTVSDHSEEQR